VGAAALGAGSMRKGEKVGSGWEIFSIIFTENIMSLSPGFCKNVSGVTAVLWALVTVCESGCIFSKSSRSGWHNSNNLYFYLYSPLFNKGESQKKIRLIKFDSLKTNKSE
jgi:hypothetical protein